jgi:hypothetical protein
MNQYRFIFFIVIMLTVALRFQPQAQPACGEWHWSQSNITATGQIITPLTEGYTRAAIILWGKVYEYKDTMLTAVRQLSEYTISGGTLIYSAADPSPRTETYFPYMRGVSGYYFPKELIDSARNQAIQLTGPDFTYVLRTTNVCCDCIYQQVFISFDQFYRGLRVIDGTIGIDGAPDNWFTTGNFLTEEDTVSTIPRITPEQALATAWADTSLVTYNCYYVIDAQTDSILEKYQRCNIECIVAPCPCGPPLPDTKPTLSMYKGRLAYEFTLSKTSSAIISKTPGRNHSSQKGIRLTSDANGITVCYFCGQNSMVTADIFRIDGKLQKSLVAGYQTPGEHTLLWNYKFNNGRTLPPGLYLLRIKAGGNEMVRRFIMR